MNPSVIVPVKRARLRPEIDTDWIPLKLSPSSMLIHLIHLPESVDSSECAS